MVNQTTDMSTCWLLSLVNGTKIGFTDFDCDLTVDSIIYKANGGKVTNISTYSSYSDSNSQGIFSVLSNVPEDVLSNSLQFASVDVFFVKRSTLEAKCVLSGVVSEVRYTNGAVNIEISSSAIQLDKIVTKRYSKICRAQIYDSECGLSKSKFELNGLVQTVKQNNLSFDIDTIINEPQYYENGLLFFKTGQNQGLEYPINLILNQEVFLKFPTIYALTIGDQISLFPGCDKNFLTCIKKFNNPINFRGEPYAPSESEITA